MLRKQRKKRTIVVGHVVLYRCFTVVSWGDAVLYCFFTDVSGGQKLNKYTMCIVVLYLLLMLSVVRLFILAVALLFIFSLLQLGKSGNERRQINK